MSGEAIGRRGSESNNGKYEFMCAVCHNSSSSGVDLSTIVPPKKFQFNVSIVVQNIS